MYVNHKTLAIPTGKQLTDSSTNPLAAATYNLYFNGHRVSICNTAVKLLLLHVVVS